MNLGIMVYFVIFVFLISTVFYLDNNLKKKLNVKKMKTYTGFITKLEPNQIFVFGSNFDGRHGAGAAKWAVENAGAIQGEPTGLNGQSYAIITTNLRIPTRPNVDRSYIEHQISLLYSLAEATPEKEFLIAYNAGGNNLSGFTAEDMADMFSFNFIPDNIIFEEGFDKLVR